jgi:SAM-dependent methyltransferase
MSGAERSPDQPSGHVHGQSHEEEPAAEAPAAFWEGRYAGAADRLWSGRANAALVDVAGQLAPGTALDLGCGEGGDAIWLASQGWRVTGLDISPTAAARGTAAAADLGLTEDQVRFRAVDLSDVDAWPVAGTYDLVTSAFLHSPVALARTEILRAGAGRVAVGGHLLVVGHAEHPPWMTEEQRLHRRFLGPDEEIAELALDPALWTTVRAEVRHRDVTGPDGEPATLADSVVLLRRA